MKLLFALLTTIFATHAVAQNQQADSAMATNFAVVDTFPVYVDCDENMSNEAIFNCMNNSIIAFIGANFKYPKEARKKNIQGKIFVNFIIEKDGRISNVEIARGVHKLLDDEAVRVIRKLPNFKKPAFLDGKPVRMQYTVPINAKLN